MANFLTCKEPHVLWLLNAVQAAGEMGNLQQWQRDSAAYQAAIAARAATGAAAANLRKRCNQCEACLTSQVTPLHSVHHSCATLHATHLYSGHHSSAHWAKLFLTLDGTPLWVQSVPQSKCTELICSVHFRT